MAREEMTNEEAIRIARGLITDFKRESETMVEFCNVAIKALEQEPILDKIRAEMLEEILSHSGTGEEVIQAYADGVNKGLQIIDKYRKEQE